MSLVPIVHTLPIARTYHFSLARPALNWITRALHRLTINTKMGDTATEPYLPKPEFWSQLVARAYCKERNLVPMFGQYEGLARLNLIDLQTELAMIKGDIYRTGTTSRKQMNKLRRTLYHYSA